MTPQTMIPPAANSSAASPNLYNQVSSMGLQKEEPAAQEENLPQGESLVDKATKRFGAVFTQFVSLTESYPGADKEATAVKDALANWLNSIANRINGNQGSSNY
jgi:hypothetical protein